jgi:transcriptional regulator with XRE-family HTH domain
MFVKPVERDIARRMRAEEGLPLREIAERLGVAKSSVSRWVRDVELSPAQEAALRDLNPLYNAQLRGQERRSRSARAARAVAQEDGRRRARDRDPLHIQGCMLYWAEGSKGRNVVAFTNSDADMVALFIPVPAAVLRRAGRGTDAPGQLPPRERSRSRGDRRLVARPS